MKHYYEFDKNKLEQKFFSYAEIARVFYPCKVNSDPNVIEVIKNNGGSFEADSIGSISMLIKKNQVNPQNILYNYPEKTLQDIKKALSLGVRMFVVDSLDDIVQISQYCRKVKYVIRLSIRSLVEQLHNNRLFADKWGTSLEEANLLIRHILHNSLGEFYGVSFYFPQEYYSLELVNQSINRILDGITCNETYFIDIGGGISIDDLKSIEADNPTLKSHIIVEPGRHLVNDCYDMICEVVGTHCDDNNNQFVFMSVGIYSGFIDVIIKNRRFEIEPVKKIGEQTKSYIVCGCTSDISDCFGTYSFSEKSVYKGALFRIKNCGAYCIPMQMSFSGHGKCKVKLKKY